MICTYFIFIKQDFVLILFQSGKFQNFKNLLDGLFYKTRLVGLGNIGLNIKFGGILFKIKEVLS